MGEETGCCEEEKGEGKLTVSQQTPKKPLWKRLPVIIWETLWALIFVSVAVRYWGPSVIHMVENMIEPFVAVIGIGILCVMAICCQSMIEADKGSPFLWMAGLLICGAGMLYFAVRIVHWAWETPIPFVSGNAI